MSESLFDELLQLALLLERRAQVRRLLLLRPQGRGQRAEALAEHALAEELQQPAQGIGLLPAPLGDRVDAHGTGQLGHLLLGVLPVIGEERASGDAALQLPSLRTYALGHKGQAQGAIIEIGAVPAVGFVAAVGMGGPGAAADIAALVAKIRQGRRIPQDLNIPGAHRPAVHAAKQPDVLAALPAALQLHF